MSNVLFVKCRLHFMGLRRLRTVSGKKRLLVAVSSSQSQQHKSALQELAVWAEKLAPSVCDEAFFERVKSELRDRRRSVLQRAAS